MNDLEDEIVAELVEKFKQYIDHGNNHYFDSDEMEMIVDYLLEKMDMDYLSVAIEKSIEKFPRVEQFRFDRIKYYILSLDFDKASNEFEMIEKTFPPSMDFYIEKIYFLNIAGRNEEILNLVFKALKLDANDPEIHLLAGLEYMRIGNVEKSLEHVIFAMKEDKEIDAELNSFSYLFNKNEQFDDAIEFYSAITEEFPFSATAWFGLGLTYNSLDKFEESIDAYQFSLTCDPDNISTHYNIANSYFELKDFDKSIEHYLEVVRLSNGEDYSAYTNIGDCYNEQGWLDEASEYYHKSLEVNYADNDAIMGIVSVLEKQSRDDETLPFIEQAFKNAPQSVELLFSLISHLPKDTKDEEFLYLTELTLSQIDDKKDFFNYLVYFATQNEYCETALNIIQYYYKQLYDNEDFMSMYHYYLAAIFYLSHREAEAQEHLIYALIHYYDNHIIFLTFNPKLSEIPEIASLIKEYLPL